LLPEDGVGTFEDISGYAEESLVLVDASSRNAPPPKGSGALKDEGNADVPITFVGAGASVLIPLNGVGALEDNGGKADVPLNFDEAGAFVLIALNGEGALEDKGGYADEASDFGGAGALVLVELKGGAFEDRGGYADEALGFAKKVVILDEPPPKGTGASVDNGG
jgi:hypothetical protein